MGRAHKRSLYAMPQRHHASEPARDGVCLTYIRGCNIPFLTNPRIHTMADERALTDRILLLPYELRYKICSFVYSIDYDSMKAIRDCLRYTEVQQIPPRANLLKEPLYIKYRKQRHDFKSDDESWARLRWPDDLEEAFLTGI